MKAKTVGLQAVPALPTVRMLMRRSTEKQAASIETQRDVNAAFVSGRWSGSPIVEYIDDDISGRDFEHRQALQKMLKEIRPGDVVVCYDATRMGRDMLDSAGVIRSILLEHKAPLWWTSKQREVTMNNAMETMMVVFEGFGGQSEHENIQTRTTDALRRQAAAGKVSNGRCFGYRNVGERGSKDRVIHEGEAAVLHRIAREYLAGSGPRTIANGLNADGVATTLAHRQGGSFERGKWAARTIVQMLKNEKYRGVFEHGRTKWVRKGKSRIEVEPTLPVVRANRPDLAIFDDVTWFAIQAERKRRAELRPQGGGRPKESKYALTALARCGVCGGPMFAKHTVSGTHPNRRVVKSYGCNNRYMRGASVCASNVVQPVAEVEAALAEFIQRNVISPAIVTEIVKAARAKIEKALNKPTDTDALEKSIARLKAEHKNAVKLAVKLGSDDDLEAEMAERTREIKRLEGELAVAKQTPKVQREALEAMESATLEMAENFRELLRSDSKTARRVYETLFPEGLVMTPVPNPLKLKQVRRKQVYRVDGVADLARLARNHLAPNFTTVNYGAKSFGADAGFRKEVSIVALPLAA